MSLHFADLPPRARIPWRDVQWEFGGLTRSPRLGLRLVLRDLATGKTRRIQVGSSEWGQFARDMECLWSLTKPHCLGISNPCGWCRLGIDPVTHDGGDIASLQWHDDD